MDRLFDVVYCSSLFDFTGKGEVPKRTICGGTGFDVIRMGYVPPAIFRLRALNYLFFWLREFLRDMLGISKPTTIYFIAQLTGGKS